LPNFRRDRSCASVSTGEKVAAHDDDRDSGGTDVDEPAFAQTKMQIRQPVVDRLQKSGKTTDDAVTEIWAAPATLAYIRDYVTRTLGKG
jgi:hypothetical protein